MGQRRMGKPSDDEPLLDFSLLQLRYGGSARVWLDGILTILRLSPDSSRLHGFGAVVLYLPYLR